MQRIDSGLYSASRSLPHVPNPLPTLSRAAAVKPIRQCNKPVIRRIEIAVDAAILVRFAQRRSDVEIGQGEGLAKQVGRARERPIYTSATPNPRAS